MRHSRTVAWSTLASRDLPTANHGQVPSEALVCTLSRDGRRALGRGTWGRTGPACSSAGISEPPPEFDVGMSIPVARWVGVDVAAVLSIEWMSGDGDSPDISSEVRSFVWSDGGWESTGCSGGGGWPDPPIVRLLDRPDAFEPGHVQRAWIDDDVIGTTFALVGPDVVTVEVVRDGDVQLMAVESPLGAVVAAARGPGRAELVGRRRDGREVGRYQFLPPS